LDVCEITKAFPGCLANDSVSLTIDQGEIHALLGENGAGKSTLVKILYGVLVADKGSIQWQGGRVKIDNPAAARRLGIGMVFQHFSLFESMTVLENIALAIDDEPDMKELSERITRVSRAYGLPLDPSRFVETLSVGERQRIEIVRCLLQNPKLLILDEPTSVLTPQEVGLLFKTLRKLSDEGCAILYISHKLDEVKALCHRATILRRGRVVETCDPTEETARSMAEMMVGEKLKPVVKDTHGGDGVVRFKASGLSVAAGIHFRIPLRDISLSVKGGEILGIAGVAGNGQSELLSVLSGEAILPIPSDAITIDDHPVANLGPRRRRINGMAFIPEERNGHGAVADLSLTENGFLTAYRKLGLAPKGVVDRQGTAAYAAHVIERFDVRTTGPEAEAGSLSGGNLQKFVVGREILQNPGVLIVSQPTWGVDPGAAVAIRKALIRLAREGGAVLVISQDLDEILTLSDRVAVICEGRLSEPRPVAEVTVEEIGMMMGGLHDLAGAAQ